MSGFIAASVVLIAEGTLQSNNRLFVRPNMAFWRGISRVCVIYLILLVFLIYQNVEDARALFGWFDPTLNKKLDEQVHTYDDNCELEWSNLIDNFDHYYVVHCINWLLAAFICRDKYILLFWQLLDEIVELSAQHILPHFRECWWDHIFCDMLFANIPAIYLGLYLLKVFRVQQYDWLGRLDPHGVQLPFFKWKVFKCHRYCNAIINMFVIIILNFLCGFFMINNLWIPPKNHFNKIRLLIWFSLSNLAFKECYQDISTWGTTQRVNQPVPGQFRWLLSSILVLEVLCCWKFRHNAGNINYVSTPIYIWLPWLLVAILVYVFWFYLRLKKDRTTKHPQKKQKLQ